MKNQVEHTIVLLAGLVFFVYIFTSYFVDAAKFESGVEIKEVAPTNETAEVCNGIDDNGDGSIDEDCIPRIRPPHGERIPLEPLEEGAPTSTPTCGLQIVSGAPINYGQLNLGQDSAEQKVIIKNEGNANARIMIKGDDWFGVQRELFQIWFRTFISGPELTKIAMAPHVDYNNKKPLSKDGWELGQMSGGESLPVYFQFRSWANVPGLGQPGSQLDSTFHQDVSIDLLC